MGEPTAGVRRPEGGERESDAGLMLRPQRRRPLKLLLVVHVEGSPLMRLVYGEDHYLLYLSATAVNNRLNIYILPDFLRVIKLAN